MDDSTEKIVVVNPPKEEVAKKAEEKQVQKVKQTQAEMETELKALEIEAKRLEVQYQKANLQDMKERLEERELKRGNKSQGAITKGATLKQIKANEKTAQERCNHRKGGNGMQGYLSGQGDDSQYAVLKHTYAHGDTWVRCLRCGKTWKPPVRTQCESDAEFVTLTAAYKEAINFPTRNVTSTGVVFKFSDNGEYYREHTKDSTLR